VAGQSPFPGPAGTALRKYKLPEGLYRRHGDP
jgi:hypothetical protein